MVYSDVGFIEVNTTSDLPPQMDVGALYFIKDRSLIVVNHGDQVVEYGSTTLSKIRYFPPYNFKTADVSQEALSSYVHSFLQQDFVGDGSTVINLYDNNMWVYSSASNVWANTGATVVHIANSSIPGVVLSSGDVGYLNVDTVGKSSIVGISSDIVDACISAEVPSLINPFATMSNINAIKAYVDAAIANINTLPPAV